MHLAYRIPLWIFLLTSLLYSDPILTLPTGVPAGSLTVSTVASGLSFPYSMQVLSDGSVLAGVSVPNSSNDYLSASGGLVNIPSPGGSPVTVLTGLPYPVQGVRELTPNLLAISEAGTGGTQIAFVSPGATPTSQYSTLGTINFTPSNPGEIFNMTLATRPTPGQPGSYDILFSMNGDTDHTQSANYATLSGLTTGMLPYNSIGMVTVTPTAGSPTVSNFREVATGLRDTAGMVFDNSGNLYLTDNGWDIPNTTTPQSADELNFMPEADIGTTILNYGFPDNYVQYDTGTFIGGQDTPPLVAFQPLNSVQSLGVSEMALAPADFPTGLNNGLFIAFYGEWEQGGVNNQTGPLLYYDFGTQTYEDIILAGQPGIGHIASLVSTGNALYIADMNSTGQIRSSPQDGIIYEIQAVSSAPEPSTVCAGFALAVLVFLKKRHGVGGAPGHNSTVS